MGPSGTTVAAVAIIYLVVVGAVWRLVATGEHERQMDDPAPVFSGIFWPAVGPILLGAYLATKVKEYLTRPKRVAEALKGKS